MKTQLVSKQFWLRFSSYFFWYLVVYTIITYLFWDEDELFWSLSTISERITLALFLALIFTFWNKPAIKRQRFPLVSKPTLKQFLGTYLITLSFILPILVFLVAIGWFAINLFSQNEEPFWPVLLKSFLVTAMLCLLINIFFSLTQLIRYQRQKNL